MTEPQQRPRIPTWMIGLGALPVMVFIAATYYREQSWGPGVVWTLLTAVMAGATWIELERRRWESAGQPPPKWYTDRFTR